MARFVAPSPYTVAFATLMCLAAGEAVFFGALIGQQRTDSALANLGGPQRMRTQRIAFLAEQSIKPGLSENERTELSTSIDTFRSAQRVLDDDPATRIGTLQNDGITDLEVAVDRYAAAANDVLQHPESESASNRYILGHRLSLLKALDKAVEAVKARSNERKSVIWTTIVSLLVLMAGLVVVAWRFVALPIERRLSASREQLRALFEDNPDAVTTYDLNGRVSDANAAAAKLAGKSSGDLRGTSFASSMEPEARSEALLAFARSASGDPSKFETTMTRADGTRVEVSANLLPTIVDGCIDGVYSVARDVTQERNAERELVEQAKRIRELYLVAASAGGSSEEQILRALEVGCDRTDLTWGFIARVRDGIATIRTSIGTQTYLPGDRIPIEKSLLRKVLGTNDVVVIDDVSKEHVAATTDMRNRRVGTFVVTPIEVDSKPYGAVGFASTVPRATPLSASDHDFIRLIAALIGAAIERGEAKERLDAMVFSDSLTGLPNRAGLDASIEHLVGPARRGDDAFAIHFLDLDGFKAVNDDHGHAIGDELLRIVAARLRGCVREGDVVARLGGDEFIILQPGARFVDEAGDLAARAVDAIGAPVVIEGHTVRVGASIGIALYPNDGTDVKSLFANADRALYRAKSLGRGRYEFVDATMRTPARTAKAS